MLKKLMKALPFVIYLIKSIIRFEDRQNQKEKNDVQNS